MSTIQNLADDMDMDLHEYMDYIVDSYTNWNKKESFKMFQEFMTCGWYDDFMDNLWNYWPEKQQEYLRFIIRCTYDD